MQDETTSSGDTQQQPSNISHLYYEVGREILSKPNLLCDIVESAEEFPILIYCNTPSDTDFVEVMLKKRGVSSQKLIGNVPQEKIDATFELIKQKQLSAIVLTDIAARLIDMSPFHAVVNYSVPQDADTYTERTAEGKGASIKSVVTLVTPLELANFHFLKKALGSAPELAAPPSPESILKSRFQSLKKQAQTEEAAQSEAVQAIAKLILSDSDKDKILGLLVHNTFNVLPAAKAVSQKSSEVSDDDDGDFDMGRDAERGGNRDRGGRGGGRYGNRRDGRGDRNDNYRSRDRYSDDDSGDHGGRRNFNDDDHDSDNDQPRGRGDRGDRGGDRGDRGERRGRQNGRNFDRPTKKDARIYVGQGSEEGITKEQIVELLEKNGISTDGLKHLSIRKNYSFFDIDDEKSADVIEQLKAKDEKQVAVKAITINAVVPEEAETAPEGEENTASEDFNDSDSFEVTDDEGDNIGNR